MSTDAQDAATLKTIELVARFAPGALAPASLALDIDSELVRDLGFDSVRLVELLLAIGEAHAVTLPFEAILRGGGLSVRGLLAHVALAVQDPASR